MEIELGWMNLTPCAKVESRPFPQLPVVKTAAQRLIGYVNFDADNWRAEAEQAAKNSAIAAFGGAGGMAALTGNPGAFTTAFVAIFLPAFAAQHADIAIRNISIDTRTTCDW